MDALNNKLNALEMRINALRLELVAIKDQLNRLLGQGIDKIEESYLQLKLKFLAKKYELVKMRSEKKMLELQLHSGNEAA